ncbi:MAG: hypothetical protein Q8L64_04225 [bacterium]|nr:hypothetical protein [bacterium]
MADKKKGAPVGAIAAGIAAVSAAAIGAYYLYGHKDAKKHRTTVKGWMLKAKGEVLEELEKVKDVSESTYASAVDAVAKKYHQLKQVDPAELEIFIREMRDHWDGIRRTVSKTSKKPKATAAKKPAKKGTKKASKK